MLNGFVAIVTNCVDRVTHLNVAEYEPYQWLYQYYNSTYVWCNNRKWQDYVYIQCEYKSTKQKIKHLLREENKVKENKIS